MNKNIFLLFICSFFFATSCKTKEKASELNYLQNIDNMITDISVKTAVSTLQKGDELVITISAKDMNVVRPFNQNYNAAQDSQSSIPSGNTPGQGLEKNSGPTYIIDSEGNIDFPVLGKLNTTRKTIVQFKDELRKEITQYVINPSVNVRITNYKITVLGEVEKPGQYTIPNGQATLLNAIGLAGDLTMYGRRDEIMIVRNDGGQIAKERINLMDPSFINSDFYQLKQGDVIYVSANQTKEKTSRLDPNMPIYISVAGIVVTILALVFRK